MKGIVMDGGRLYSTYVYQVAMIKLIVQRLMKLAAAKPSAVQRDSSLPLRGYYLSRHLCAFPRELILLIMHLTALPKIFKNNLYLCDKLPKKQAIIARKFSNKCYHTVYITCMRRRYAFSAPPMLLLGFLITQVDSQGHVQCLIYIQIMF